MRMAFTRVTNENLIGGWWDDVGSSKFLDAADGMDLGTGTPVVIVDVIYTSNYI